MFDDDQFGDVQTEASPKAQFSEELVSKKIKGRQRTFFIDLKQSVNGKFVKMSELSRGGQRSTIMFDGEDLEHIIQALEEVKAAL